MNTDELRAALRRDADLAGLPRSDLVDRVAALRRRSNRRRAGALAGAVGVVLVVAAVLVTGAPRGSGPQVEATTGRDPEASARELTDVLRARGEAGAQAVWFESLPELLPNAQYRSADGALRTVTELVVVGHVTAVSPGRGFSTPADDAPGDTEVAFDDPRATWRTFHAEVSVTEVIAGELAGDTVQVGFSFGSGTPVGVVEAGLPALGDVVFFLQTSSPLYAYDPSISSVAQGGTMLTQVGAGGRLTMPAIEPERAEQLLSRTPTLQALRAAAQLPTHVEPVETLQD